ncbi:hypothetical protein EDM80_15285 [bacterium]|nr:MAG: hypothetical protein EDM80_15285 [bacterium]
MLATFWATACGGGNNAANAAGSASSSSSGPDLSTPAAAAKAVAEAFASGDFAKFDPIWSKTITQEKKDRMKKDYREVCDAGGNFKCEFNEADIKIEGDKAEVKSKLLITPKKDAKAEEEKETLRFVKEDGKWMYTG